MAKESKTESVFSTLNGINVNEHTEKKGNLTYLAWAWAWSKVKENYPDAFYTIYENASGWNYHTDGKTCWVKTGVTINGLEHIEYLPVMDFNNKSIPAERVTSFDVNKAIQRSLTKAAARHGLGLYIYAGEDLPENTTVQPEPPKQAAESEGPTEEELSEAFEMIRPNIENAPSHQYLQDLHVQNVALHNYKPYKAAMNKRYKEVK